MSKKAEELYREALALSEEEREALPENPAGAVELTDEELDMAAGGSWRQSRGSYSQLLQGGGLVQV